MSDYDITSVTFDQSKGLVVLERIGAVPDYCVHGETLCVECGQAVWLGDKTLEVVKAGTTPICVECAVRRGLTERSRHVQDHRRADGPHEEEK